MFKWINTAQLWISEIQEIEIYAHWGMAVPHKQAVIFDTYKCPETRFKFLAAVALAIIF